ncbi:MAG TPA: hypothetical protein EYN54_11600 [Methylococcaceae bacterium]|nr:hypothetical protein [Methylococcaceae bacterium]
MIKLQKFEVAKMVMSDSIRSAYTVSVDGKHKVTFSTSDVRGGSIGDKCLILVTQKGHIKEFKTLDAVRSFMQSVNLSSFTVCG